MLFKEFADYFFVWEFADAESNVFSKGRLAIYFT